MRREDYWNRFNTRQRAIEKRFINPIKNALEGQYRSFLREIKRNGYQYAKSNIERIVRPDEVVRVLKKMYRYAAYIEGNYVGSSLIKQSKKSFSLVTGTRKGVEVPGGPTSLKRITATDASFSIGFDEIAQVVDEYFRIYQLNISGLPITETTVKHIQLHLIDEVERGVPLDDAVRNFRELAITGGTSRSRTRAKMILQTESTRAMSFGALLGAYKTGIEVEKIWVTCADEKVRTTPYSHRVLDGQATELFRAFNNGEPIKFPGDPEASVENTVRCRCCQLFRQKPRARPRVRNRSLTNFLVDFFSGFFLGTQLLEALLGETAEP